MQSKKGFGPGLTVMQQSVPPAELANGFHTQRSGKGLFDGGPVKIKIVLLVGGCCDDKKVVGKPVLPSNDV